MKVIQIRNAFAAALAAFWPIECQKSKQFRLEH